MKKEIAFGGNNEKRRALIQLVEPPKIRICAVHDVEGSWLPDDLVQNVHVVEFSVGDVYKTRDGATQVHERVHFDGGFSPAKFRPGKQGEAKIDQGGIQCVGHLLDFHAEFFPGVKRPCNVYQDMSEVVKDSPISFRVRVGQRTSGDRSSKTGVVQFGLHGPETGFDVAETFASRDLREGHAKKLIEAREISHSSIAVIAMDAFVEFVFGEEIEELRKDDSSLVHEVFLFHKDWKKDTERTKTI